SFGDDVGDRVRVDRQVQRFGDHPVLRAEEVVDQRRVHTRFGGDRADRRALVSPFGEQLPRRRHDLFPCLGLSRPPARARHARRLNGVGVAVRVIPCLDVDAGRVVKGVNFENLRDAGDPVELAARYDAEGADELTFLDVTASSGDRETTYDVVRRTAEQVFIPLTVGGGVRTCDDV